MPEILKIIIDDLLTQTIGIYELKEMTDTDCLEYVFLRYSLGKYIRNKFLWHHPDDVAVLSKYYNIEHIDDVSVQIVDDALQKINKN